MTTAADLSAPPALYMGVDVQVARGCPVVVLDAAGRHVHSAWLEGHTTGRVDDLRTLVDAQARDGRQVVVGIDAPRQPLPAPRRHYWQGGPHGCWRSARPADRGFGRHCEIVVAALDLARPQWTPLDADAPAWMRLGFACFRALETLGPAIEVVEVFPSASYRLFDTVAPRLEVSLAGFLKGPKDMLDAYCAAATAREYGQQRGWAAGGGDGLGTIVLPGTRGAPSSGVHAWPATHETAP